MTCLVVLQAVQENVQVEGGDVVPDVHISVQRAQARQQVGQQRALGALRAEHAAAVALAHLAAIGCLHHALKACTNSLVHVQGMPFVWAWLALLSLTLDCL